MVIPLGLSFDDVLLIPQRSEIDSRAEVNLKAQIAPNFFLNFPIIATNMDSVTGVNMAVAMSEKGGLAFIPRFDGPEIEAQKIAAVKLKGARVFATVGLRDDCLDRAKLCVKAGADGFLLDVAHGHMIKVLEGIKILKNKFNLPLVAGTVATEGGATDIFSAGADCVKVGVGAGSICITRIMAGAGVPQITALQWASQAAKKFKNKFVLADGGIKNSGDIVKALAAGANAVTLGSLLAGTDEAPGEIIEKNSVIYKEYNGSTSKTEKERQRRNDLHIEGVEALVKYKGPVGEVLDQLCAGIQSGLSYCGARNIAELWKKAQFIQVTNAGYRESGAHDMEVVEI